MTTPGRDAAPGDPQHISGMVVRMIELPTWAAIDVIADDLESLSRHHKGLGIRARDARALRRVAELVRRHDTVCRLDVA